MSKHAIENAKAWYEKIVDMVAALDGDTEETELAGDHIWESVLSVQVRDGWRSPGAAAADAPAEYEILLTTGGPALRLYGHLDDYGEPDDEPELQWQDWGTPWTRYWPENATGYLDTLRTFARQFYFGD